MRKKKGRERGSTNGEREVHSTEAAGRRFTPLPPPPRAKRSVALPATPDRVERLHVESGQGEKWSSCVFLFLSSVQIASKRRSNSGSLARLSMSFVPPYRYVTASALASALKNGAASSSSAAATPTKRRDIAIIDVRDDDFEGGNIVGALNVPSTTFDQKVHQLVEKELKDGEPLSLAPEGRTRPARSPASPLYARSPHCHLPLLPLTTTRSQISAHLLRDPPSCSGCRNHQAPFACHNDGRR